MRWTRALGANTMKQNSKEVVHVSCERHRIATCDDGRGRRDRGCRPTLVADAVDGGLHLSGAPRPRRRILPGSGYKQRAVLGLHAEFRVAAKGRDRWYGP